MLQGMTGMGKLTGGCVFRKRPQFVLLDLGGAALAAQTSPFPLIEEARDDVLARATCTCTTT